MSAGALRSKGQPQNEDEAWYFERSAALVFVVKICMYIDGRILRVFAIKKTDFDACIPTWTLCHCDLLELKLIFLCRVLTLQESSLQSPLWVSK